VPGRVGVVGASVAILKVKESMFRGRNWRSFAELAAANSRD
jgi:hypothetical protein